MFDFIVLTEKFKEILPEIDAGVYSIRLNKVPPDYFDLDKIKVEKCDRLLAEGDWLFEFDVPGKITGRLQVPKRNSC